LLKKSGHFFKCDIDGDDDDVYTCTLDLNLRYYTKLMQCYSG